MSHAIEATEVTKHHPGFSLQSVTFSLPEGYVMAVIGPNGTGKTTLIKLLLNLTRPDKGTIRIFGRDPAQAEGAVKRRIGFVHEVPHYFNHLALEQIKTIVARFYPDWKEEKFRELSHAFGLPLDRPFGKLSKGTKTKFALLLALSHDADLLILDEPTSGLDPVFRRTLLDHLRSILQDEKKSILFSSQITSDIERIADYVTYLRKGTVVFSSRLDEIRERWGVIRGGPDLLEDAAAITFFRGHVRGTFGIQAVTDQYDSARRYFREPTIVEPASLEDILFLMEGRVRWSTGEQPCVP